jgi:hypothetical protein
MLPAKDAWCSNAKNNNKLYLFAMVSVFITSLRDV